MTAWVINVGEPIPGIDGEVRSFRYAMVTSALIEAGHSVVRWSSSFRHITKDFRAQASDVSKENRRLSFRFLRGIGYKWHRSPRRLLHHALEARAFRAEIAKADRPDVIFVSIPTLDLAWESVRYGQAHHVPVVVDISDCWPDHYLTVLPSALRPLARPFLAGKYRQLREVLGGAGGVTSISRAFLDWAKARGAEKVPHADVFPIGYEWPEAGDKRFPAQLQSAGLSTNDFIVLFVGTFTGSYDFAAVVEAARMLVKEEPKVKFVFGGSGPREDFLRGAVNELPNVRLLGWIDRAEDLAQIVANATVGLCPYRHDSSMSLPNKPFEYMAAGKAILSSLEGEFREILTSNKIGIQYRSDDAAALAGAIRKMARAPEELVAMGNRARDLFRSTYTPERIYPQLVAMLEKLRTHSEMAVE